MAQLVGAVAEGVLHAVIDDGWLLPKFADVTGKAPTDRRRKRPDPGRRCPGRLRRPDHVRPTLLKRLADLDLPIHVICGESDGIVDPEYGQAYADAIRMSTFTVLPRSGYMPQVETPEELLGAITDLGD